MDSRCDGTKRSKVLFSGGSAAQSFSAGPRDTKTVCFRFFAPHACAVSVVGSFNNWVAGVSRLERDFTGMWQGMIHLPPGRYEYRLVVNDTWADDPGAAKTVPNAFGTRNAVLEVK